MTGILAGCGDSPARTKPNIVLVTVDTLRADHLEVYGYDRRTAPNLARLASEGVRFSRAMAQAPWTLPSMASLHSSLYPTQHGAVEAKRALPDTAVTLAERLRESGYATVGVVSHQFVGSKHGFSQGFDFFDERNSLGHEGVSSRALTKTALEAVRDVPEPFFLWVHYFDPHFTYVRHPEYAFADGYAGTLPTRLTSERLFQGGGASIGPEDLDYIKAVYDEEIAFTDAEIGELWDALMERHGSDSSILVVTGDHGEYFLERGRFFHGRDVYGELIGVPLVIGGAISNDLRGSVVRVPVATRSIPRTVMGLLGLSQEGFDGVDLLGVARGEGSEPVFSEGSHAFGVDARKQAVIDGQWKLIHRLDDNGYELYDLEDDPGEKRNRWGSRAGSEAPIERLQGLLDEFNDLPGLQPKPVGLAPEAIRRLRALGYTE